MKIAVLTSPSQWFVPYAKHFSDEIGADLLFDHMQITEEKGYDILFLLSYHKIVPASILKKNRRNIVVHASKLPEGKGWAPMFWQILEGKNEIPFTMFEAGEGVDNGDIYMVKTLKLDGSELHDELRDKQAKITIEMCREFIERYDDLKDPVPQEGCESFYPKRSPKDSRLDIDKSIREQFSLLRIVDNEEYPAYFDYHGHRYILRIEKEEKNEDR
jgi:methionyl-tRNA formyltransferase